MDCHDKVKRGELTHPLIKALRGVSETYNLKLPSLDEPLDSQYGEHLKLGRELAGMSQQDVADLVGVSKMAISKYENNAMMPSGDIQTKLADTLNVETKVTIGKRLRLLRSQANWTLAELSQQCGKSVSFLSDIEHGRGDPSLSTLAAIAKAFDMTVPQLLSGVEIE
jgi:transcriptional regulator with XRE-family HTH domain